MSISPKKRRDCYKRDGHVCVKCGSEKNLTIDHIIPVSQGGKCHLVNLQTMCKSCNLEKGASVMLYRADHIAIRYICNRGYGHENFSKEVRNNA